MPKKKFIPQDYKEKIFFFCYNHVIGFKLFSKEIQEALIHELNIEINAYNDNMSTHGQIFLGQTPDDFLDGFFINGFHCSGIVFFTRKTNFERVSILIKKNSINISDSIIEAWASTVEKNRVNKASSSYEKKIEIVFEEFTKSFIELFNLELNPTGVLTLICEIIKSKNNERN